jgi:phosphoserine phosphatase RsbU/P
VDLAGHCRPALGIGGDYYDFIALDRASNGSASASSRLGIAIGDVSGKGISAALLMASLRASLRGQTLTGFDLAHLVRNVNLLLYDSSDSNRYATFFFAEYDPSTRQLTYVNAGHNAPVVLRRRSEDGQYQILRLEEGGPVVGLMPEVSYQQSSITMEPGDVLLGYTDGISEAMNPLDEEWGEDRMIAKALSCPQLSAQQILDCIFESADAFASGAPQHDDMTLILMKIGESEGIPG